MALLLKCSKGCGHSINVTDDMVKEAVAAGVALDVKHEVCPTEATAAPRRFKITTAVVELVPGDAAKCLTCEAMLVKVDSEWRHPDTDDEEVSFAHTPNPEATEEEVIASIGYSAEAPSFKMALPVLQSALEDQWGRIVGMADIVDAG